jgi:hypothetical protein
MLDVVWSDITDDVGPLMEGRDRGKPTYTDDVVLYVPRRQTLRRTSLMTQSKSCYSSGTPALAVTSGPPLLHAPRRYQR